MTPLDAADLLGLRNDWHAPVNDADSPFNRMVRAIDSSVTLSMLAATMGIPISRFPASRVESGIECRVSTFPF